MKLLVTTQVVDTKHPILGFFHRWIAEFAQHCESVIVIGQEVGDHNLPENVTVLSLGKEKGYSVPRQILEFWRLVWRHRNSYTHVFVHMIYHWLIFANILWMGKKKHLWYEHRQSSLGLRVGIWFCNKTFSVSPKGMPIKTSKTNIVGHGIDTTTFAPSSAPASTQLISVGRLGAAKNVQPMIDAFAVLPPEYTLRLVGKPVRPEDFAYVEACQQQIASLGLGDRITIGSAEHADIPVLLQQSCLFIHASETGLDKAVLEAMACGCPVLSASDNVPTDVAGIVQVPLGELGQVLPRTLEAAVNNRTEYGQALHEYIVKHHSLPRLMQKLITEMA